MVICASCDAGVPLVGTSTEPVLVMILPVGDYPSATGGSGALLVDAGPPNNPSWRTAESIAVRRHSDQALLNWVPDTPTSDIIGAVVRKGNLRLTENGEGGKLGRRDLNDGDSVTMTMTTSGRMLSGGLRVPPRPILHSREDGEQVIVSWPKIAGVEYYLIFDGSDRGLTSDTARSIPRIAIAGSGGHMSVFVASVDAHYAEYLNGGKLAAGLQGGYGVFGALTFARIEIGAP